MQWFGVENCKRNLGDSALRWQIGTNMRMYLIYWKMLASRIQWNTNTAIRSYPNSSVLHTPIASHCTGLHGSETRSHNVLNYIVLSNNKKTSTRFPLTTCLPVKRSHIAWWPYRIACNNIRRFKGENYALKSFLVCVRVGVLTIPFCQTWRMSIKSRKSSCTLYVNHASEDGPQSRLEVYLHNAALNRFYWTIFIRSCWTIHPTTSHYHLSWFWTNCI